VDRDGRISVPYVGRIPVAGQLPAQVASATEEGLKGKAIEPQVLVSVVQAASATAVVAGDVTGGGRIPLSVKGDRLLEVIAQAGGIKASPIETFIRLTRGGATAEVQLATLLKRPDENIFIEPGDVIYVTRKPQTFTALGSVIRQGELGIDREEFNLSQALGMMGGLNTVVADTTGVFLFREENPAVLRALRPQSQLLAKQMPLKVIYRLNFSDPSAYFLAAKMPVRQGDMVYVSNAPSVDFVKIVSVLRLVAQTTRSIQVADPNY
jgi:polysaccharide export outer membrane protein